MLITYVKPSADWSLIQSRKLIDMKLYIDIQIIVFHIFIRANVIGKILIMLTSYWKLYGFD